MENNLSFWTGVVENRNDPQLLGRCQVRIFGVHTEDIVALPTSDLPWAIPLQSVTSAAISGVGSTPVGIVPGTWVMGFFLDGTSYQKPVILGTLAGKPGASPLAERAAFEEAVENDPDVLKDSEGNPVLDGSGQPIKTTPSNDPLENFGNLTKAGVVKTIQALGNALSGGDYSKADTGKFGKYQFTYQQLIMLGYVYPPKTATGNLEEIYDPALLDNLANWAPGKNSVFSKEDFLSKFSAQEDAMVQLTSYNYKNLVRLKKIKNDSDPGVVAGLLSSAHIGGYSNADKLGRKTGDETLRKFFLVGAEAVSGQETDVVTKVDERGTYVPYEFETDISEFAKLEGFQDPNKEFPKYEYRGKSDINKLALGDRSHILFEKKENLRQTEIPKARTTDIWDEPKPVFGACYPYNQVLETEAGHVIELDSTPGAERIHVFHKAGTHMEIDVNGSMVRKVVGDNYEVIDKNNYVYVKGAETITIEGKTRILVKDEAHLEVEGGLTITSNRDMAIQTARTMGIIADKFELSSTSGIDLVSGGPINIQGTSVTTSATDGAIINSASKGIFNTAGEQINISSGTETRLQAGKQFDITSGTNTNIDAGGQLNIRMAQAQPATLQSRTNLGRRPPPELKTPETSEPDPLDRNTNGQAPFISDDDPEAKRGYIEEQIENGEINPNIADRRADGYPTYGRQVPTDPNYNADCSQFNNLRVFSNALPLSKKYKLGNFLVGGEKEGGWAIKSQAGLSASKIVCNLQNLANNVMEPIRQKYPSVIITSGFRNLTSRLPNESSDHLRGCAVDLQFRVSNKEYVDIAEWIRENIPYKQLLLEYETDDLGRVKTAWIHVSSEVSSVSGRPIPTGSIPVATVVNHDFKYRNQLVNLA
jgi:hypothetical protein